MTVPRDPDLSVTLATLLAKRTELSENPYSIALHQTIASLYETLAYPDLAAGSLYKTVLLLDALRDESDEYHDHVRTQYEADTSLDEKTSRLALDDETALHPLICSVYCSLATNLLACECYRSAHRYCLLGLQIQPDHLRLNELRQQISKAALARTSDPNTRPEDWSDTGLVRRELYPWNTIEPDRFAQASLDFLNDEMKQVAPKLEVRAVELENLTTPGPKDGAAERGKVWQLGVFATDDIEPGEQVLSETSILTANNRLNDSLCDACSTDIDDPSHAVECDDCETVFCSADCRDRAEAYHPAICDRGLDSLARDVPPAQAADSLYLLLCLRALAMAVTQDEHPLNLKEVRYIWGDYQSATTTAPGQQQPCTLPFSFDLNVVLPLDILTKLDVDIFRDADRFDIWIFNTLYAKFRGTASARLSGLKGTVARGPEVSAVHPLWCLANHSCDPNVRWEWGGRMNFWARDERAVWTGRDGHKTSPNLPGLRKDQEVLGHYCDIDLAVEDRREWAAGALGGDCRCERCIYEAAPRT